MQTPSANVVFRSSRSASLGMDLSGRSDADQAMRGRSSVDAPRRPRDRRQRYHAAPPIRMPVALFARLDFDRPDAAARLAELGAIGAGKTKRAIAELVDALLIANAVVAGERGVRVGAE